MFVYCPFFIQPYRELSEETQAWIKEEFVLPVKFRGFGNEAIYILETMDSIGKCREYDCYSFLWLDQTTGYLFPESSDRIYTQLQDMIDPARSIRVLLEEANAPLEWRRQSEKLYKRLKKGERIIRLEL